MWASYERWWAENIVEKAKKQATSQIWAQFLAALLTQCSTRFENFKLQFLMRDSKTSPTECSSSFLSHMNPVCLNVTSALDPFLSWWLPVITRIYLQITSPSPHPRLKQHPVALPSCWAKEQKAPSHALSQEGVLSTQWLESLEVHRFHT